VLGVADLAQQFGTGQPQGTIRLVTESHAAVLSRGKRAVAESHRSLERSHKLYRIYVLAVSAASVLTLGCMILAVNAGLTIWPAALAASAALGLSVLTSRSAAAVRMHRRRSEWLERSVQRLTGNWVGTGDFGEDFRRPDHLYAEDLDLFGEGSLFELLTPSSATTLGRSTLAGWLLNPCSSQEAMQRQEAVDELRSRSDVQLELCCIPDALTPSSSDSDSLREWAAHRPEAVPTWYRLCLLGLAAGLLGLGLVGVGPVGLAPHTWVAVVALASVQGLMCLKVRESIERTVSSVASNTRALRELEKGARLLERQTFRAPLLRSLQESLRSGSSQPASVLLTSLNRRIGWLQARNSDALLAASYLLAWATQWGLSIESWQIAHGSALTEWADAFGSFEGLCAVAAFAGDHPKSVSPSFRKDSAVALVADKMEHPLLQQEHAVSAPVRLDAENKALVITGSNMSGKSTYLRAVGLNCVLARAGAPVRAARFELSEFSLVVSARIDESVHERRSRFLVEASKLAAALDTAASGEPVLLLADEMLSGTNSADRRIGARAIVDQLITRGGSVLLTTHDVELAKALSERPTAQAAHFQDQVIDGELSFDYHLRPGIVSSSNAVIWLRALRVDV